MTAAEDRGPVVADAWRELEALAAAMRPDWRPEPLGVAPIRDALVAARAAMPFEQAARQMWRLIWDPDGTPAELRNTARSMRPQPATGAEVNARGKALALAAIDAKHEARHGAGTGDNQEGTPS